ncbi:hypothetical protein C4D60_Mb04t10160 [Musa balbisiana]|uniref:Uncharacterized protein n=1 Tax=Musa balbisiana TaxID=52838 RepID=A0A4S8KAZ6_MUSBA|nr:hypothetical protein C4D60_Mb04t10160 [Musa balbisiana]
MDKSPDSENYDQRGQKKNKRQKGEKGALDEGKVILPVSSGGRTTPFVTSLQLRQTQAQDTTSFRIGHRSPLASTRRTISRSSSGRIDAHLSCSCSSSSCSSSCPEAAAVEAPSLPPSSISSARPPTPPASLSRRCHRAEDDETLDSNAFPSAMPPG